MSGDLPDALAAFLQRPNPAVIAVVRPDGRPISVPTWYLYVDRAILVNLQANRARARHLRVGAPVSLTVLADGDWYRHTSLQGIVREALPDPDHRDADRLSEYYTGAPHSPRDGRRLSAWIDVVGWHAWRIVDDG